MAQPPNLPRGPLRQLTAVGETNAKSLAVLLGLGEDAVLTDGTMQVRDYSVAVGDLNGQLFAIEAGQSIEFDVLPLRDVWLKNWSAGQVATVAFLAHVSAVRGGGA